MKIAIDGRFLIPNKMEGFGVYTLEVCTEMANQNPSQKFYIFVDRLGAFKIELPKNCVKVLIPLAARLPILWKLWYDILLPLYCWCLDIDVFMATIGFVPKGNFKKISIVHDINFEHFPQYLPIHILRYYLSYFKKYCQQSDAIIAISEYTKQDIMASYGIAEEKITVVYNGARLLKVTSVAPSFEHPYFIALGSLHPRKNVEGIIESFKLFKQQNLTHKLIIAGAGLFDKSAKNQYDIPENMSGDILFVGRLEEEELANYMSKATALVFIPHFEGFGLPIVEAMALNIPVIASNNSALPEVCGDAALLHSAVDYKGIAESMHRLSEDIELRNELIKKGKVQVSKFNWSTTAKEIYTLIQTQYAKTIL